MKKLISVIVTFLLLSTVGWAYDQHLAASYAQFFQPFAGQSTSKALHMMKTPDFVKQVKEGQLFILDVRTPNETGLYGITVPGSVAVSMDRVFHPEVLAMLPKDKKIVIICKAGHRASIIAIALRHIGFSNTYSLKLGLQDLAKYLSPKTAY